MSFHRVQYLFQVETIFDSRELLQITLSYLQHDINNIMKTQSQGSNSCEVDYVRGN